MSRRSLVVGVIVLLLVAAGGLAAFRYAATLLKGRIETALGPESTVGSITVEGRSVVVRDIVMRAPADWPTAEALRAESIVVAPDLRALVSGDVRIASIVAERVYLSIYRKRGGKFELLPSLLGKPKTAEPEEAATAEDGGTPVALDTIDLHEGVLEVYDGQVRTKPHRIRIEGVEARVGPLAIPSLNSVTRIDVGGLVKGPKRDGTIVVDADIRFSDLDSTVAVALSGVDLVALEPYLIESNETGVKSGKLDLEINSTVEKRRLSAPGTMTLSNLELTGSTFMGMSRKAVLAALEGKHDTITIRFTLAGSLDDPQFSLRENFATRVGCAVADGLGLGVRGLAETLGSATQSVTKKLGEILKR